MNEPTWVASLEQSLAATWQRLLDHLPAVLGAALLLVVGWAIARLLRALTTRSIARVGALFGGRRIEHEMQAAGVDKVAAQAAGTIVFWVVFLVFVAAAGEFLGLAVITAGLDRVAGYLPTILGAVLVLVFGIVVANVARTALVKTAARARLAYGETLGQVARGTILLVAVVVALDQIGIDSELLITATSIVLAAILGGAALAFALGSRDTVGNILALHYVMQSYKVGQRIRLGDLEGEIVEFKKTGVVIDSPAGACWSRRASSARSARR